MASSIIFHTLVFLFILSLSLSPPKSFPLCFLDFLTNTPRLLNHSPNIPSSVFSVMVLSFFQWLPPKYSIRFSFSSSFPCHCSLQTLYIAALSSFQNHLDFASSIFSPVHQKLRNPSYSSHPCTMLLLRCVQNKVGSILFTNISHRFLMYEFLCVLLTHLVFACFHAGLNMVELAIWAELFKSRLALILG